MFPILYILKKMKIPYYQQILYMYPFGASFFVLWVLESKCYTFQHGRFIQPQLTFGIGSWNILNKYGRKISQKFIYYKPFTYGNCTILRTYP